MAQIGAPVFSWFGENDVIVPRSHADHLVTEIPHAVTVGCPDCRHDVPIAHWPQILEQTQR